MRSHACRGGRRAWIRHGSAPRPCVRPMVTMLEDRRLLSTPTFIALRISSATTVYGQSEVLTATVTTKPASSTLPSGGTVTFLDRSVPLKTVNLNSGVASFSTTNLDVGVHVLTAEYSGDSDFSGSHSGTSTTLTIDTVAGGAVAGSGAGDGGLATRATLNNPSGIAIDASGDIFIADTLENRIREVNGTTGVITTVAGNGTGGSSGDGGPATAAQLAAPAGIALDKSGQHLFIADSTNNVVREVNLTTGLISTLAGNGTSGYTGNGGPATAAELNKPRGVALDSMGNIYIADSANQVIREVSAATGVITTVAGNGTPGYAGDGGPATSAALNDPAGLAVSTTGNILIADSGNSVVREVNVATDKIATVVGNGTTGSSGNGGAATAAELFAPAGSQLTPRATSLSLIPRITRSAW